MRIDLSWLERKISDDQKSLRDKIQSMLELTDKTTVAVQRISTELRPGMLDDLGLAAAFDWQAGEFEKRTGIKCKLNIDPEDFLLDQAVSTAFFRIFQEALTNVVRHAEATHVNISLKSKDHAVVMRVHDNGKGIKSKDIFDPKSFGLIGIRERAHFLNGKVTIKGISDKGTTIEVIIPLSKKEDPND